MPAVREVIQTETETPSVLFIDMPLGRLDIEAGGIRLGEARSGEAAGLYTCLRCSSLTSNPDWWCSEDCWLLYLREDQLRRCPTCGTWFQPTTMCNMYCSKNCRGYSSRRVA